jgi:CBS domain-containing protein
MPRSITEPLLREVPVLDADEPVGEAVHKLVETGLPALPVVESGGELKGIFGEREFIAAFFPAYLGQLKYAGFVKNALEDALEKRQGCLRESVGDHANTEHVDVGDDWSDAGLAEIFLHHRVLIVPVFADGRVRGVITRTDFFRALVDHVSAT